MRISVGALFLHPLRTVGETISVAAPPPWRGKSGFARAAQLPKSIQYGRVLRLVVVRERRFFESVLALSALALGLVFLLCPMGVCLQGEIAFLPNEQRVSKRKEHVGRSTLAHAHAFTGRR